VFTVCHFFEEFSGSRRGTEHSIARCTSARPMRLVLQAAPQRRHSKGTHCMRVVVVGSFSSCSRRARCHRGCTREAATTAPKRRQGVLAHLKVMGGRSHEVLRLHHTHPLRQVRLRPLQRRCKALGHDGCSQRWPVPRQQRVHAQSCPETRRITCGRSWIGSRSSSSVQRGSRVSGRHGVR